MLIKKALTKFGTLKGHPLQTLFFGTGLVNFEIILWK